MSIISALTDAKIASIIRHGGDSEFYGTSEARAEVEAEIIAQIATKNKCEASYENSQKVKQGENNGIS